MRGLGPRAPRIYRFLARMAAVRGGYAAHAIPAPESALRLRPRRAVSPLR